MDENRRRAYLDALGIEVWVPRAGAPAPDGEMIAAGQPARAPDEPPSVTTAPAPGDVASMDWGALRRAVAACQLCELRAGCSRTVFGIGAVDAQWMIVGEAPGAEEDRQGEPFVGRAGLLLNAMLMAIGLRREKVFIANILKCRPPGNRDPRPLEAASCEPYLKRQIALLRPKIILAVGRVAAQNLLRTQTPIGRMRGKRYSYGELGTPVVVTYHPAYLLRSPADKRKAFSDLQFALSVGQGQP
ncbi:MAG: uracil-DNA glycosylase [Gammaproteobacteria bacterium]|nr:uracil-DNA glycosylase [Gammaproteobacteria bacterium]